MTRYAKLILCITAIIIISILLCLNAEAVMINPDDYIQAIKDSGELPDEVTITEPLTEESEQFLWNTLMKYLDGNEKVVAGIMGYFRRESGLKSNAVPRWFERDAIEKIDSSNWYTEAIDQGLNDRTTKEAFLLDNNKNLKRLGGYGLGQWHAEMYLDALYEFARTWDTTIGDAEMQCAFMVWSLQNQRTPVWKEIKNENNIYTVGRKIAYGYDGAAAESAGVIISYTVEYYKKYGTSN